MNEYDRLQVDDSPLSGTGLPIKKLHCMLSKVRGVAENLLAILMAISEIRKPQKESKIPFTDTVVDSMSH